MRCITHQLHGRAPCLKKAQPNGRTMASFGPIHERQVSYHIRCSSHHHAHSSAGPRSSVVQQRGHPRTRHHEPCERGTFANPNLARPARDATACLICYEATAYSLLLLVVDEGSACDRRFDDASSWNPTRNLPGNRSWERIRLDLKKGSAIPTTNNIQGDL